MLGLTVAMLLIAAGLIVLSKTGGGQSTGAVVAASSTVQMKGAVSIYVEDLQEALAQIEKETGLFSVVSTEMRTDPSYRGEIAKVSIEYDGEQSNNVSKFFTVLANDGIVYGSKVLLGIVDEDRCTDRCQVFVHIVPVSTLLTE